MARVTAAEVKEIFDTNMREDWILAFINSANLLVTRVLGSSGLGADDLKDIERWIAAHFCNLRDPISLREKIGDAESWNFPASVTTAWTQGLGLTVYGQQAVAMDTTGTLAALGLKRGKFRAAPREDSDNYTRNLTKA